MSDFGPSISTSALGSRYPFKPRASPSSHIRSSYSPSLMTPMRSSYHHSLERNSTATAATPAAQTCSESLEESLMKICILGMENDRLLAVSKALIREVSERDKVVEEYKGLLEERESAISSLVSGGSDVRRLERQVEDLSSKLSEKEAENDRLRKRIGEGELASGRVKAFEREARDSSAAASAAQGALATVARERDELWEELEQLRWQDQQTNRESIILIRELKDRVKLLAGENDRLLAELATFEETSRAEIELATQENQKIVADHERLRLLLERREAELEEFARVRETLLREKETLIRDKDELLREKDDVRRERVRENEELARLRLELGHVNNERASRIAELELDIELAGEELMRSNEERRQQELRNSSLEEEVARSRRLASEEVQRLRKELDDLRAELKTARTEAREFRLDAESLKAEKNRLIEDKEQRARSERTVLEESLRLLKEENASLQREKTEKNSALKKAEVDMRELGQKFAMLGDKATRERAEFEGTTKTLRAQFESKTRDLEDQLAGLRTDAARYSDALAEQRLAREDLERRLRDVSFELKKSVEASMDLEKRARLAEDEGKRNAASLVEVRRSLELVNEKLTIVSSEKEELRSKTVKLETYVSSVSKEKEIGQADLAALNRKIADMEDKLLATEKQLREKQEVERKTQLVMAETEITHKGLVSNHEALKSEKQEIEVKLRSLQNDHERLQEDLIDKNTKLSNQKQELEKRYNLLLSEHESAKTDYTSIREKFKTEKFEVEKKYQLLQSEYDFLQKDLNSQRDRFKSEKAELENKITSLQEDYDSLQRELKENKDRIKNESEEAEKRFASLQIEYEVATNELKSSRDRLISEKQEIEKKFLFFQNEAEETMKNFTSSREKWIVEKLEIEQKFTHLQTDHEFCERNIASLQKQLQLAEESLTQLRADFSSLQNENKELKIRYESWLIERDALVLAKQREESIAIELRHDNTEKSFKNMQLLLKVAMISSELDRVTKPKE